MRLIDADALKANVPDTSADIFENCRNCKTLMDWQVKELIDQQPTASPWHRVEDGLPKHGQHILICLRFTNLDGEEEPAKTVYGYFENFEKKGRRYWTWEDEEVQMQACMSKESDFEPEYGTTRITHWMPIEPPKEGKDA